MGLFDFFKKKEIIEISELKSKLVKYQPIIDIEEETENKKTELEQLVLQKKTELDSMIETKTNSIKDLEINFNTLNSDYKNSLEIYTKLRKEISLFESKLDVIEFGIYEPVYDFERSDDYRNEQALIIDKQKAMIKADIAARCSTTWTVQGSATKGKTVVNKYKKLMLRAFNGECDSLISKVKWNNINQMKERMHKLFESINKLGEGFSVFIDSEYMKLKKNELILEYEYQLKRQKEKEELRRIQEELREEEKVRKEIEQAQREAEKDEENFQKALEKAQKEIEQSTGEKHEKLLAQIEKLQQELKEAQAKKERALSMAQQTKRGYVYIISNIGSFGENVYKIGLTRRLEPHERIKELGDASVPFQFDVHALIYSEDAPTLEYALHKAFDAQKVNMMNYRKEFFKVTLEEIEQKLLENAIDFELVKLPEAMEYRETLSILNRMNNTSGFQTVEQQIRNEFPETLV